MSKFNVGDRVAVYGYLGRQVGTVGCDKDTAGGPCIRVDGIQPTMTQMTPGRDWVHPKQCRRLKSKKQKLERIWVNIYKSDGGVVFDAYPSEAMARAVSGIMIPDDEIALEFVRVKK